VIISSSVLNFVLFHSSNHCSDIGSLALDSIQYWTVMFFLYLTFLALQPICQCSKHKENCKCTNGSI